MVRRSPMGACQCWRPLAIPRDPRSSRLATLVASSTWSSPDTRQVRVRGSFQASPRPTTKGRYGRSTAPGPGRCGCGAWRRTAPSGWPSPWGVARGEPVERDPLAAAGHLLQALAQVGQGGDEGVVGLAQPEFDQLGQQQVHAVADLGLGDPYGPAGPPVRQPVQQYRAHGVQADLHGKRRGAAAAGRAGWEQVGQAAGQVGEDIGGQRRTRAV